MFADMLGGWFTRLARARLVNSPGPKLIDLFLLEAGHVGLQRGGAIGLEDLWEVEVKLGLLLDDVVSDGPAAVVGWHLPPQGDTHVVPVIDLEGGNQFRLGKIKVMSILINEKVLTDSNPTRTMP